MIISAAKDITSSSEPLKKVDIQYLYNSIRNPKPVISSHIQQLRIVRQMDERKYRELKRQLPYIVCGIFNPPFRKSSNFAYTSCFIMDLDHISFIEEPLNLLRKRIESDKRVHLSFLSPSGDGLKLIFRLSEPCYDSGLYSLFYRAFVLDFAHQYGIESVVDGRTSDVTRACFISYDTDAFYRPDSVPIVLENTINPLDVVHGRKIIREIEANIFNDTVIDETQPTERIKSKDPDEEILDKIKELLGVKKVSKPVDKVYVPCELDEIMPIVVNELRSVGVEVNEVINISYGKKVRVKLEHRLAEINIFYGKKGYTVVESPRTGTSSSLNEVMAESIRAIIDSYTS